MNAALPPVLEAEGLAFAYPDGTQALAGIDLRVHPGEAVGLVGPNGAGKSTLVLHLGGFLTGRGTLKVAGLPVTSGNLREIRRRVGLVFQDPDDQLFMPTVHDDVAFGPLNLGLAPAVVEERVARALSAVGMAERVRRSPHRLSGGERRAVALATVLAMEPDLLVLDEPAAYLDPRGRRHLIAVLQALSVARLIVSHDLELVLSVCPRTVVLDGGRIVADGPSAVVLSDEPLMTAHGLEVPHSLLAAEAHRHLHRR